MLSQSSGSSIEASLSSITAQVSSLLVVKVLKKLSNAGALALSFFRWAEKQKGFKYNTKSYNALIEALGKIKQFKLIWDLVSDLKRKGLLSKDTFTLIERRYTRARKTKEAIKGFQKMEKFGLKLEVSDYNRLIDTLSKSRHVEKAQELFDKTKKRKFIPDVRHMGIRPPAQMFGNLKQDLLDEGKKDIVLIATLK